MENNSESKYSKPGFDGRLKYYDHLKYYWDKIADATFEDQYSLKYKCLRGYFSRTRGFIKDPQTILTLFKNAKSLMDNINSFDQKNQSIIINNLFDKLQTIEDELFMATKDMLVSTKDDGDDDFDMDEFLRQSD